MAKNSDTSNVTTTRTHMGKPPLPEGMKQLTITLPADLFAEVENWASINEATVDETIVNLLERALNWKPKPAATA
jgi:hypothetical protein